MIQDISVKYSLSFIWPDSYHFNKMVKSCWVGW